MNWRKRRRSRGSCKSHKITESSRKPFELHETTVPPEVLLPLKIVPKAVKPEAVDERWVVLVVSKDPVLDERFHHGLTTRRRTTEEDEGQSRRSFSS